MYVRSLLPTIAFSQGWAQNRLTCICKASPVCKVSRILVHTANLIESYVKYSTTSFFVQLLLLLFMELVLASSLLNGYG